jgi:hypothetical protein
LIRSLRTLTPVAFALLTADAGCRLLPAQQPHSTTVANALVARGDTMLFAGRLFGAESAYYRAAYIAPHDGNARMALGRYEAGRGRWRIAAVMMEEARHFGSDPSLVAVDLAPVYSMLGIADSMYKRKDDWAALAALPSAAIPLGERLRAEYLRTAPPDIDGPDSSVVMYTVSDSHLLGRVKLAIGNDTVFAVIDAKVRGLVLDTAWMRRDSVKKFGPKGSKDPAQVYGVMPRVKLGEVTFTNVPVRFQGFKTSGNALVGLDWFGALAPTFDPRVGYVLVRKGGRVSDKLAGWRIPSFDGKNGVMVVKGDTMFPVGHPDVQQYFRVGKWTWDARRGTVVVDSVGVSPVGVANP